MSASSDALKPLLLTRSEAPSGYSTSEPQVTPPSGPEFYGALPPGLPAAYVTFSMNSGTGRGGAGGSQNGIIEAVARSGNAQAAARLLHRIDAFARVCVSGGTVVPLPGSVPNLSTTETTSSTSSQATATSEVFAHKGDDVVEVRFFNTNLADTSSGAAPVLPEMPNVAAVGALVDAAIARLPARAPS